MNVWIILSIGVALGLLLALPAFILMFRRVTRRKVEHIQRMEDAHRSDWQTLIHLLNHTGQIPPESTGAGLTDLMSRGLKRSIRILKELQALMDWRTQPVIEELEGMVLVELEMLNEKLDDILEAHRNHLRDFDYKQEPHDTDKGVVDRGRRKKTFFSLSKLWNTIIGR